MVTSTITLLSVILWGQIGDKIDVVFVPSVPYLQVVASLVSSYCFLRVIVCCLRGVGSMSSSRRIPRFIVPYSSGHRCVVAASFLYLRVVGSSFRRLRYILDSGIKVNFSRLCCTRPAYKVEFDWFLPLLGDIT